MNPIVFVLFGVTGDLARRKIMPALSQVARSADVPIHFVGYGRRSMSQQEFKDYVVASTGEVSFVENAHYIEGELDDSTGYKALCTYISSLQPQQSLFYLALPPRFYLEVVAQLDRAQLCTNTTKLLLEKPFGLSSVTAQQLETILSRSVTEHQIYRVDHFLGKPTIRTLHRDLSEHFAEMTQVSLKLWESSDVAERGALYDELGASRDMIQNHVCAILAQLLSSDPTDPNSRAECMKTFTIGRAQFGQYIGFRAHPGVDGHSHTETFISFGARSGKDIDIQVETGKALANRCHLLTLLNEDAVIAKVNLDTDDNAYETLLQECIAGDHTYFVSWPEVTEQWRITEQLLALKTDVIYYHVGSNGLK